jgi:hypothetical protein
VVTETELRERLEDALDDILCFCGNYKRMGKPFCFRCFDALPRNWQSVMRVMKDGICQDCPHQYDAAREWLKQYRSARFQDRDSAP